MRVLLSLVFLILSAFAGELKIASFNAENLFDGANNGNEYRDFVIGKSNWNNEKYLAKNRRVSSLLNEMDADIVALQEIENFGVLERLAKSSGYKYYKFTKPKNSPFGVGFISRIPFENSKIYSVKNEKTRDILRVDVSFDGGKICLYTLHFPAQKNPERTKKASLNTLKNAIKDGCENSVILGDFNSEYGKDFIANDIIRVGNFKNLWEFVGVYSRSSHISNRAIDHVLLSPSFFDGGKFSYKPKSFGVFESERFYDKKSPVSDHKPLFFTLTSTPNKLTSRSGTLNSIKISEISLQTKTPFILKEVAVIYKDRYGFALSDKSSGMYVFDKDSELIVGNLIDAKVNEIGEFKGNLEITSLSVSKIYDKILNLDEYFLAENKLKYAKNGDVIKCLEGDVKNGTIHTKFGSLPLYKKGGIKDGYYKFQSVYINEYKGKLQGNIR